MNTHEIAPRRVVNPKFSLSLIAAALAASSAGVGAQDSMTTERANGPLEEVIVSAQRRDQSLQDVPISVQVLGSDFIDGLNIIDMQELSNDMPGVTITQSTAGSTINIRGIGSGNSPGFQQSVGTFVDGIYLGRGAQSRAAYVDVQRIEVLRGPQSTYFGNNTIGGAINVTTRSPGTEFEASVATTYEPDDEELTVDVGVGGPVNDKVGARLAVRYYDLGGWMTNSVQGWTSGTSNEIEVPQVENVSGRFTLTYDPSEDLAITLKTSFSDQRQDFNSQEIFGCTPELAEAVGPRRPGRGPNGNRTNCNTDSYAIGGYEGGFNLNGVQGGTGTGFDSVFTDLTTENHSLNMTFDVGDHQLISLTGWSAYENLRDIDTDGSPWDTAHVARNEDFDQISQEFRLISPEEGRFTYLAGLYFDATNLTTYQNNRVPDIFRGGPNAGQTNYATGTGFQSFYDEETESIAAFAAGTWNLTENLSATLGLRYTSVDKDASLNVTTHRLDNGSFGEILDCNVVQGPPCVGNVARRDTFATNGSNTFDDFNQSLDLNWRVADEVMLYASYKNGFKAGGFDPLTLNEDAAPLTFNYDEETVDAYELGMKSSWLDGALELNATLFRSEYEDLQVSVRDLELQVFFIENAAGVTTEGLEIDGRWAIVDRLVLGYSFSFLDAAFDEWVNEVTGQDVVPPGEPTPFSPEYSGNLNLRYDYPITSGMNLSAMLNMSFTDDYKTIQGVANPATIVQSFERWGARIELSQSEGKGWSVALIGKNLTDEQIWRFAVPAPQSATGTFMGFADRGRSVSLQAKYDW